MPKAKTWEEYKAECEAVAKPGITILGHTLPWEGGQTKLRLHCMTHNKSWETTSINNFKRAGRGCPSCANASRSKNMSTVRKAKLIKGWEHYEAECKVLADSKTTVLGYVGEWQGVTTRLRLHCSLHGEWCTTSIDNFKNCTGCPSCGYITRASKTRKGWQEYKTECEAVAKSGITVLGWVGEWKGRITKLKLVCPLHGEFNNTSIHNFLSGHGCPLCAGHNQQQCYINIVKDGSLPVALKVGIARDSAARLRQQNSMNLFQMTQIAVYEFPTVESCKAAEKACLSGLTCGVLSARELQDGYTETVALTDYDKVVSIYERFGGVRVDTLTEEDV